MLSLVCRDLVRNPRRTLAALAGVVLGVGLFSGVLFFIDASGATMTQRALAPLALDVQSVLSSPLGQRLRLEERVAAPQPLRVGGRAVVTLIVTNETSEPVHEVVVNDEPPPPLSYLNGTTTLGAVPLPDRQGQSPLAQGLARSGLNIGTLAPGDRITLTYSAKANRTVASVATLAVRGTISSREDVVPVPANAPAFISLQQLRDRMARIPGVATADALSFVDLPAGTIRGGRGMLDAPVRVFAFDPLYVRHYPSIHVVRGEIGDGSAVVSVEAGRALGVQLGATVELVLPGNHEPLRLPISGFVDLAQAEPLFSSRKARNLEEFLYQPFAVVVPPDIFRDSIVPAFRAAGAQRGSFIKNQPVLEVDVLVDRSRLRGEPADALRQTSSVADAMRRVAPQQHYLIDNISNSLAVARDDAAVGKRMFTFLGLPGIALAAVLTAYGASIHAISQRRELATLRLHGADRSHFVRILMIKTVILSVVGALLGVALGLFSAAGALDLNTVLRAGRADLVRSGVFALVAGLVTTGLALYVPGRRSLRHGVSEERAELAPAPRSLSRRWWLDVVLLCTAGVTAGVQLRVARVATSSVSAGEAVSLPSRLLVAPFALWVGGPLVSARVIHSVMSRRAVAERPFGPLLAGTLVRSIRRRSSPLLTGIVGVGLVVAFATNMTMFAHSYDAAKAADTMFLLGSDLRVTPSAQSVHPHPAGYAASLRVAGVVAVTPVVFAPENSLLIGPFDQDRTDLAAIDAATFRRVAALLDVRLDGIPADRALRALENDPRGLLVRSDKADDLSIENGDPVEVLVARGTKQQTLEVFHVVGLFDTLPGFPQGVDLIANIAAYRSATGLDHADYFLAKALDASPQGVTRVADLLRFEGTNRNDPIRVETAATARNKDQSSLTAVNVRGLVAMGSHFATAMGIAAIAIFVFGLLLQRRREFITLRALGLSALGVFVLLLGEALLVSVCGLGVGLGVGVVMGRLFVRVLEPLFVLAPHGSIPFWSLGTLSSALLLSTLLWVVVGTVVLCRLSTTAILREL